MTEIKGENYTVTYNYDTATICLQGSLRLSGMSEYQPILDLLNDSLDKGCPIITINVQELEFLNSSGISMLSKFIINAIKNQISKIILKASSDIPWQGKSLKNLQRLLPSLQLDLS